ncbi:unnamed protein product [Amoebophrya sp. A120]|nr:unnamed protein product [Amoebophrya sp. A120]|eukprot:GSA120T00022818001.1
MLARELSDNHNYHRMINGASAAGRPSAATRSRSEAEEWRSAFDSISSLAVRDGCVPFDELRKMMLKAGGRMLPLKGSLGSNTVAGSPRRRSGSCSIRYKNRPAPPPASRAAASAPVEAFLRKNKSNDRKDIMMSDRVTQAIRGELQELQEISAQFGQACRDINNRLYNPQPRLLRYAQKKTQLLPGRTVRPRFAEKRKSKNATKRNGGTVPMAAPRAGCSPANGISQGRWVRGTGGSHAAGARSKRATAGGSPSRREAPHAAVKTGKSCGGGGEGGHSKIIAQNQHELRTMNLISVPGPDDCRNREDTSATMPRAPSIHKQIVEYDEKIDLVINGQEGRTSCDIGVPGPIIHSRHTGAADIPRGNEDGSHHLHDPATSIHVPPQHLFPLSAASTTVSVLQNEEQHGVTFTRPVLQILQELSDEMHLQSWQRESNIVPAKRTLSVTATSCEQDLHEAREYCIRQLLLAGGGGSEESYQASCEPKNSETSCGSGSLQHTCHIGETVPIAIRTEARRLQTREDARDSIPPPGAAFSASSMPAAGNCLQREIPKSYRIRTVLNKAKKNMNEEGLLGGVISPAIHIQRAPASSFTFMPQSRAGETESETVLASALQYQDTKATESSIGSNKTRPSEAGQGEAAQSQGKQIMINLISSSTTGAQAKALQERPSKIVYPPRIAKLGQPRGGSAVIRQKMRRELVGVVQGAMGNEFREGRRQRARHRRARSDDHFELDSFCLRKKKAKDECNGEAPQWSCQPAPTTALAVKSCGSRSARSHRAGKMVGGTTACGRKQNYKSEQRFNIASDTSARARMPARYRAPFQENWCAKPLASSARSGVDRDVCAAERTGEDLPQGTLAPAPFSLTSCEEERTQNYYNTKAKTKTHSHIRKNDYGPCGAKTRHFITVDQDFFDAETELEVLPSTAEDDGGSPHPFPSTISIKGASSTSTASSVCSDLEPSPIDYSPCRTQSQLMAFGSVPSSGMPHTGDGNGATETQAARGCGDSARGHASQSLLGGNVVVKNSGFFPQAKNNNETSDAGAIGAKEEADDLFNRRRGRTEQTRKSCSVVVSQKQLAAAGATVGLSSCRRVTPNQGEEVQATFLAKGQSEEALVLARDTISGHVQKEKRQRGKAKVAGSANLLERLFEEKTRDELDHEGNGILQVPAGRGTQSRGSAGLQAKMMARTAAENMEDEGVDERVRVGVSELSDTATNGPPPHGEDRDEKRNGGYPRGVQPAAIAKATHCSPLTTTGRSGRNAPGSIAGFDAERRFDVGKVRTPDAGTAQKRKKDDLFQEADIDEVVLVDDCNHDRRDPEASCTGSFVESSTSCKKERAVSPYSYTDTQVASSGPRRGSGPQTHEQPSSCPRTSSNKAPQIYFVAGKNATKRLQHAPPPAAQEENMSTDVGLQQACHCSTAVATTSGVTSVVVPRRLQTASHEVRDLHFVEQELAQTLRDYSTACSSGRKTSRELFAVHSSQDQEDLARPEAALCEGMHHMSLPSPILSSGLTSKFSSPDLLLSGIIDTSRRNDTAPPASSSCSSASSFQWTLDSHSQSRTAALRKQGGRRGEYLNEPLLAGATATTCPRAWPAPFASEEFSSFTDRGPRNCYYQHGREDDRSNVVSRALDDHVAAAVDLELESRRKTNTNTNTNTGGKKKDHVTAQQSNQPLTMLPRSRGQADQRHRAPSHQEVDGEGAVDVVDLLSADQLHMLKSESPRPRTASFEEIARGRVSHGSQKSSLRARCAPAVLQDPRPEGEHRSSRHFSAVRSRIGALAPEDESPDLCSPKFCGTPTGAIPTENRGSRSRCAHSNIPPQQLRPGQRPKLDSSSPLRKISTGMITTTKRKNMNNHNGNENDTATASASNTNPPPTSSSSSTGFAGGATTSQNSGKAVCHGPTRVAIRQENFDHMQEEQDSRTLEELSSRREHRAARRNKNKLQDETSTTTTRSRTRQDLPDKVTGERDSEPKRKTNRNRDTKEDFKKKLPQSARRQYDFFQSLERQWQSNIKTQAEQELLCERTNSELLCERARRASQT